jgi:adenosylcobinamide-GDP ribazoletransferase
VTANTESQQPSWIASRSTELAQAFSLLTRLPTPNIAFAQPIAVGAYVWAFPIAGLAVGALSSIVLWLVRETGAGPSIAALAAIAASLLATGALHEDGLADFCDGIGGGRTRERKLAIMRDSAIGTFGAAGLFLSLAARWSALASFADPSNAMVALIAAHTVSRAMLALPLEFSQPARKDGLAARTGGSWQASAACVVIGAGIVGIFCEPGLLAVSTVIAALAVVGVMATARRHLGGYTGDVLGAAEQTAETLVLVVASVLLGH